MRCSLTSSLYLLLFIALIVNHFDFGSAISCYVCKSHEDANCKASPNKTMDCEEYYKDDGVIPPSRYTPDNRQFFCIKKIDQAPEYASEEDGFRVIRGCGHLTEQQPDDGPKQSECITYSSTSTKVTICNCYTDYCNHAASLSLIKSLIVIALLVTFKLS